MKLTNHLHLVPNLMFLVLYLYALHMPSWGKRDNFVIYNKPTRCNSGSIVFIKNYKYALHVLDALCVHLQEHYKL